MAIFPGGKGRADFLQLGDFNAVCYQCGRKRKGSTLLRYWQGYYVCEEHWETRQPQDFVRSVPDVQTPPWQQPLTTQYGSQCFPNDVTAIADYAVADCVICDYTSPFFDPDITP